MIWQDGLKSVLVSICLRSTLDPSQHDWRPEHNDPPWLYVNFGIIDTLEAKS